MLIEIGKLPQLPQRVLPKVRTHIVRLNNLYDCLRLWVDSLYARQLFLNALHLVTLFVINDDGAWMIKRPQDFPREEIPKLIQMARERNLTELYEKSRVRVADRRVDVPREPPHVPTFNKWSANQPGTTYFLPVNELSALYINFLLAAFNEEFSYFVVDDRNGYRPAGLDRFARSKGGHLRDDPARGRFGSISVFEAWLHEFV